MFSIITDQTCIIASEIMVYAHWEISGINRNITLHNNNHKIIFGVTHLYIPSKYFNKSIYYFCIRDILIEIKNFTRKIIIDDTDIINILHQIAIVGAIKSSLIRGGYNKYMIEKSIRIIINASLFLNLRTSSAFRLYSSNIY
ncbi:hypothetical protein AD935_11120 [Gluconobacter japonicus]|nr:hypothetical protein AD935_11120 [Gluconobacter japonicus]